MNEQRWESFHESTSRPDEAYAVVIDRKADGEIYAYCACKAGENRIWCKHREKAIDDLIAQGELTIANSTLGTLLHQRKEHDRVTAEIKKERQAVKNRINQAMKKYL